MCVVFLFPVCSYLNQLSQSAQHGIAVTTCHAMICWHTQLPSGSTNDDDDANADDEDEADDDDAGGGGDGEDV